MSFDPLTTAVLAIEYQNDFATDGGALNESVGPVMEETGMLPHSISLVQAARDKAASVIHAPISFAAGYNEISRTPYGILKGVKDTESFEKESWGVRIVDAMRPEPGDIVLEGKRGLDTFASTNLDFILRSRRIETLAIAGFLTNACVESTARSAYENGYKVVTITDCMAAASMDEHRHAVAHNFPHFSTPMTHVEFLGKLAG